MSTSRNPVFEHEKEKIVAEIAKSIEELLSISNEANRGLEDEARMTRDYINVAQVWETFKSCTQKEEPTTDAGQTEAPGLPGTGGHVPGRTE